MASASLEWQQDCLKMSGTVTVATVNSLLPGLDGLFPRDLKPPLTIDCSDMTSSDSSAIALLVEIHRRAQKSGITIEIKGISQQLENLITIYGVDWILGES